MSTINKSKHIIEFEHLYKKGQTVWFLLDDEARSGKVEIVSFDVDSGRVSYFIHELGWFEECNLFLSKADVELNIRDGLLNEIQQQEEVTKSFQYQIDRANKRIKELKSSPWLAKATNQDE